jgi:hypothetical protein
MGSTGDLSDRIRISVITCHKIPDGQCLHNSHAVEKLRREVTAIVEGISEEKLAAVLCNSSRRQ